MKAKTMLKAGRPQKEKWVPVKGFEKKYQVSNYGQVRSIDRQIVMNKKIVKSGKKYLHKVFKHGRLLKPSLDSCGYLHVRFYISGRASVKLFKVHRLVAQAFLPDYSQDLTVNHRNGDKTDNRIANLQMMTKQQNYQSYVSLNHRHRYMDITTGKIFFNFKCYCKQEDLPYNKYSFVKAWTYHFEYLNTDHFFRKID